MNFVHFYDYTQTILYRYFNYNKCYEYVSSIDNHGIIFIQFQLIYIYIILPTIISLIDQRDSLVVKFCSCCRHLKCIFIIIIIQRLSNAAYKFFFKYFVGNKSIMVSETVLWRSTPLLPLIALKK